MDNAAFGVGGRRSAGWSTQEFDSIQVDNSIANNSPDLNRFVTGRVDEFDIDPSSYDQVRKSKQTNPASAHLSSTTLYRTGARRTIGNYAERHINIASLPSTLISLWLPVPCHTRNLTASRTEPRLTKEHVRLQLFAQSMRGVRSVDQATRRATQRRELERFWQKKPRGCMILLSFWKATELTALSY
jgi:hypothetical protein